MENNKNSNNKENQTNAWNKIEQTYKIFLKVLNYLTVSYKYLTNMIFYSFWNTS